MKLFQKTVQKETDYTELNFFVFKKRTFFEISWTSNKPEFGFTVSFSWDFPIFFSINFYRITVYFTFFSLN